MLFPKFGAGVEEREKLGGRREKFPNRISIISEFY
jgi:hypothetical protein